MMWDNRPTRILGRSLGRHRPEEAFLLKISRRFTLKRGWKRGSRQGTKTRREEKGRRGWGAAMSGLLENFASWRLERSGREVHRLSRAKQREYA